MQNNRDFRLDFAKGILISLVVIGHSFFYGYTLNNIHQDTFIYKVIYSFHMPAFMLLSGYFFYNTNKRPLARVILLKIKTIVVPFIAFSVTMWILMHIKDILFLKEGFSFSFFELLDYVLTSKIMWYLASLFINCLLVATLSRIPYGYIGYILVMIVSLFIPANHSYVHPGYPFMFPFFIAGYYMMKNKISLFSLVGRKGVILCLVVLSLIGLYFYNRDTYIYGTGMYILTDNPMYSMAINIHRFVIGVTMTALFFTMIGYIIPSVSLQGNNKTVKMFVDLGTCSLGIYGFQQILIGVIIECKDNFQIDLPSPFITVLASSVLVIFLSYYLTKLCTCNNLLSILYLGRKRKATA